MQGSSVFFIEQNLLPFRFEIAEAKTFRESCHAIRTMQVRGAGAIGALAGFAMAQACLEAPEEDYPGFLLAVRTEIESTRPTARNLFHATGLVYNAGLVSRQDACTTAQQVADKDAEDSRMIGEYGNGLIHDGHTIETHCNAGWLAFVDHGTALSPIYQAHRNGKNIFVYVDETRPRGQGARLTAWELMNEGVPHVIIPDHAGAWLMSLGKIDMMITGADRIAMNGDIANKIGTLEKAITARHYGIPFYVAAPTSTFDRECESGKQIPIEERSGDEILYQEGPDESGMIRRILVCNPGSAALNPAFDITPSILVTGIITEKGIVAANEKSIRKTVTSEL